MGFPSHTILKFRPAKNKGVPDTHVRAVIYGQCPQVTAGFRLLEAYRFIRPNTSDKRGGARREYFLAGFRKTPPPVRKHGRNHIIGRIVAGTVFAFRYKDRCLAPKDSTAGTFAGGITFKNICWILQAIKKHPIPE